MDLHAKLIGNVTLLQGLLIVAALIAASFVFGFLKRMMAGNDPGKFHDRKKCPSCGWVGTVSKYKPACGKCGNKSLIAT